MNYTILSLILLFSASSYANVGTKVYRVVGFKEGSSKNMLYTASSAMHVLSCDFEVSSLGLSSTKDRKRFTFVRFSERFCQGLKATLKDASPESPVEIEISNDNKILSVKSINP